jgi:hypothetical protein
MWMIGPAHFRAPHPNQPRRQGSLLDKKNPDLKEILTDGLTNALTRGLGLESVVHNQCKETDIIL